MLCDECGEREAEIQVTKIVGGEISHLNLCRECAQEIAEEVAFSMLSELPKFLKDLLDFSVFSEATFEPKSCSRCGLTIQEFQEKGRLGCSECYKVFWDELDPLLKRVHGSRVHRGKAPSMPEPEKIRRRVNALRKRLEKLIKEEKFEEAAQVRDMIRDLEKKVKK